MSKVAIVCDDLIQFGGAEKINLHILDLFPGSVLYTSTISNKWRKILDSKGIKYQASFLDKFPFKIKLNRVYSVFLLHVIAFQSFDFSKYDLVISLSSRYSHMVRTKPGTKHICYMHSPGRMIWESNDYFKNEIGLFNGFIKKNFTLFLSLFLSLLRVFDYIYSQKVDEFISNSILTSQRIKKYFKRESIIIHPYVDMSLNLDTNINTNININNNINTDDTILNKPSLIDNVLPYKQKDYFLVITRLISWKKVDIAIEAFRNSKLNLVVIGEGPDKKRLMKLSKGCTNIKFLGYVSDEYKYNVLRNSRALIQTQKEDFGLVPLEALSVGVPVIAYGEGGIKETMVDNLHGVFFHSQDSNSLSMILNSFDEKLYLPLECISQSKKFDKVTFDTKFTNFIKDNI